MRLSHYDNDSLLYRDILLYSLPLWLCRCELRTSGEHDSWLGPGHAVVHTQLTQHRYVTPQSSLLHWVVLYYSFHVQRAFIRDTFPCTACFYSWHRMRRSICEEVKECLKCSFNSILLLFTSSLPFLPSNPALTLPLSLHVMWCDVTCPHRVWEELDLTRTSGRHYDSRGWP